MSEPETSDTDNDNPEPSDTETVDWKAEAEKYKTLSRKHEERAKANTAAAKELAEFKRASMSEQERAVAEAREQARTETLREVGSRIVDAEIRVAFAGRDVDIDAVLEGLDRTKFLTETGAPDIDAIERWRDRIAPIREVVTTPTFPDLGQGTRGDDTALNADPLLQGLKDKLGIR